MSDESIALIILAGGESTRFGEPKGLFEFEGEPLILKVINALGDMADKIVVSVAPGQRSIYQESVDNPVKIVEDKDHYLGPLFGLRDARQEVRENIVMLAPCDTPFISSELYSLLMNELKNHDAAVPILNDFPEPITAVYRNQALNRAIDKEIQLGGKKLSGILKHIDYNAISEAEWLKAGLIARCFLNLNLPPE